jgi:type II secretory pathway pseudopilin PulG
MRLDTARATRGWRTVVRRADHSAARASAGAAGGGRTDEGYIMVALLVGIAVSAVWMSALLPSWRQQVVREREAELIFRGEQYARAIFLYRQKNNQTAPPNIDTLVNQRYLRKKYLDPITGKDFLPVGGVMLPGGTGPQAPPTAGRGQTPLAAQAGVTGVRSTSNDTSIVIYRNQQTYSQFPFDWALEAQRAGAGGAVNGGGPQVPGGGRGVPGAGRGGADGRGGAGGRGGLGADGRGGRAAQPPAGRGRGGFIPSGPGRGN